MTVASAVAAEGIDAGVPAHYGNPFAEQRNLTERVGFVDRSNRGVIRVAGEDRWSWLHSLTTQHLEKLGEWRGIQALILTQKGHVEHDLWLSDDSTATWLDVEPGTATPLAEYLEKMRFMLRVEPVDVTTQWALFSLLGPESESTLHKLNLAIPEQEWAVNALDDGGWIRRTLPLGDVTQFDLLVQRADLHAWLTRLRDAGATPAGLDAFEALRVAARRPRLGFDTDHRTLVQEVDWVPSAVHLQKGCYRGQETVAKVQNLGQRPRRMVLLHLDGSTDELPKIGAAVSNGDKRIGFVGTVVRHYELGTIALAIVKQTTPDSANLQVGTIRVAID